MRRWCTRAGTPLSVARGPRLTCRRFSYGRRPPPPPPFHSMDGVRYRPSLGVHLFALAVAGTSTFYLSRSAWLHALGDEPSYFLDRIRNDKRSVVFSEDYDQNWWGFERFLPSPLSVQNRYYHRELAQQLVEGGMMHKDQFIMPEIPAKQELQLYNTSDYLEGLGRSRFIAKALGIPALRFFPSLIIHTFISGFMLEAVGGTVLATRVALTRGWAINLGGGFHHASAHKGSQGCLFNDVSLAIRLVRENEKGQVKRILIIDLTSTQGDGFVCDFGLDEDVYIIEAHRTEDATALSAKRPTNGSVLEIPKGMTKESYLRWVSEEIDAAFSNFRPQLVYYVSGSSVSDSEGNSWIQDRDALVFRLAVDKHATPLVMVVNGGWIPGNDPKVMARSINNVLSQRS